MQKIYFTILFAFTFFISKAQVDFNLAYFAAIPMQKMADNINPVHQVRLGAGYQLKNKLKNINIGAEFGAGNYANLRVPTTFSFGNGNPTSTYVNYSSNVFSANAVVNVDLIKNFIVTPYITIKGGYQNWFSNIYVEDPNDIDGCKPLERKSILKDHTTTVSYGGGIKYELNKNKHFPGKHYIDLQVTSVRGGNMDYINTRQLKDHNNVTTDVNAKPLNMQFINVQSNVIHDHKVAQVYNTPLRLLEIKLGYYIKL